MKLPVTKQRSEKEKAFHDKKHPELFSQYWDERIILDFKHEF